MITVYQDNKNNWHLMRFLTKEGFGIKLQGYCDNKQDADTVEQLPDGFLTNLCMKCKEEYAEIEKKV